MNTKPEHTWVDRAIQFRHTPLLGGVLAIFGPVLFVWQLVPAIGVAGAELIPASWERKLGEYVLREVQVNNSPRVSEEIQNLIRDRIQSMLSKTPLTDVKIYFVAGTPNAYALPGNIIVITDGFLNLITDNDQIDAVIGHELGHLIARDNLKSFLGIGLLTMLVKGMTGDYADGGAIADLTKNSLLSPSFSRQSERQADQYAHHLLIETGRSPEHFGRAMENLERYLSKMKLDEGRGLFSSHPVSASRIEAAKEAANKAGFDPL